MENLVETVSVTPYSGAVSMGSMGSAEPINFLRGVLEPIKFLEWMVRKLVPFGVQERLLNQTFKADYIQFHGLCTFLILVSMA